MSIDVEVLIVGSGPSGVMAAEGFLASGLKVCMLDAGFERNIPPAPSIPFSSLCHEKNVKEALLSDAESRQMKDTGMHLTPFRAHTVEMTEDYLPIDSSTFFPLQSLAKGGLSASWGAATFTYDSRELSKMGLPDLRVYYQKVSDKIGISGPASSIACDIDNKQSGLIIDDNATQIWQRYQRKSDFFQRKGLLLEPASLAVLSSSKENRQPNPYYDTDFWNNPGNNVFRADFWVDRLKANYANFTYQPQCLVNHFTTNTDQTITVFYKNLSNHQHSQITAKKLILCAGAINSYRIAATSLGRLQHKNPILCNPYRMLSTIHLPMLGRIGSDKRYSLAQLFGLLSTESHSEPLSLQFYSYRSLLLYRLMLQTPLPRWAARLWWRALVESLVIVGMHYPAFLDAQNSIQMMNNGKLNIEYPQEKLPLPWQLGRLMLKLRCVPIGLINNRPGASIHYAGTLPNAANVPGFSNALTTNGEDAHLAGCPNVHVLDGSTWNFLPAKGLTFTLMANSLRLSEYISEQIA